MFSYMDLTITLTDADGTTVQEWAFKEVLIDSTEHGILLRNKKNKIVFFIKPSRDLTLTIEETGEDHCTYKAN
ncbi:MAG: hypothetical protein K5695_08465 [Oscillospiraceae bacterium]|nr:hypothetical protein [Oscillospiraceae bacterium]MCR4645427.1 hypothetical protein [Oscillospiraceae bacterium]